MQLSQHYYATASLARGAGFSETEALQIAYADQYTDDATDSSPVSIPGPGGLMFDPVRPAHIGLEAWDWRVQKQVFIPFHFLPPVPIRSSIDSWLVEANGRQARSLLDEALGTRSLLNGPCGPNWLMRLGIALHTFQDQWSHEGFSGRHHDENDVAEVLVYNRALKRWETLWSHRFVDFLTPAIGHAEAGFLPDQPHVRWRVIFRSGRTVTRDNVSAFLDCHRVTYGFPASEYQAKSARLFHTEGLRKYDQMEWKRLAFESKDPAEFYDSLFYKWHRAALHQRCLVLENLL